MLVLEVEPLDLGADVRAVSLELVEGEDREPAGGPEAVQIWTRTFPALAGDKPWALDFFSHLDKVRAFCDAKGIAYRQASAHLIVVPAPETEKLAALLGRFERETFGLRAGEMVETGDAALESELARRGADAYHPAYPAYFFCAICSLEDGSVVILSNSLWASEIVRRVRPAVASQNAEVRVPA